MGLLRMGRLSILVMSRSRSANTLSALNSCPGPSGTLNTTDVLYASAAPRAARRGRAARSGHALMTMKSLSPRYIQLRGQVYACSQHCREQQCPCEYCKALPLGEQQERCRWRGARPGVERTCHERLARQQEEAEHVGAAPDAALQHVQPVVVRGALAADRADIPAAGTQMFSCRS